MPPMKLCRDCGGTGGDYPIVGEGKTSLGYYYPILSDFWQDCEPCEGTGQVVDHDAYDRAEMRHDPLSDERAR